jgi:hypothetical protein
VKRVPVSSSAVKSVGYDAERQILEIEYSGGRVYHYHDVSPEDHQAMMDAPSHGAHLNSNVKGVFRHTKGSA